MIPGLTSIAMAATFCTFDASEKPNPLGMRSYVSVLSTKPNRTRFIYDAFGNVANDGAKKRQLVVPLPLAKARAMMRSNAKAFSALIGDSVPPGDDTYKRIDVGLKCAAPSALDLQRADDPARVRAKV